MLVKSCTPSPAIRVLVLALVGVVLSARDAHAYLDPASGSMILQLVVGGAMGALYFARKRWHTVRGWFGRRGTDGAKAEDAAPPSRAD